MSPVGIFIFGLFITAIVGAACFLIVMGIRADSKDRARGPDAGLT